MPERPADAVAGIGQHAAEAHAGGGDAVDLGQGDLGLGLRHTRRLGHAGGRATDGIVGPALGQEQPQPDRDRHFAARERERHQCLAVRLLAELAAILRPDTHEARALLRDGRVIDHQHRVRAADQLIGRIGQHAPQRRILPRGTADEVVQLVVSAKPDAGRDRLHALRPVGSKQATYVERSPTPPRAAPHHIKKRRQPLIEIVAKLRRPGHSTCSAESQPDTKPIRSSTSAKVVLGTSIERVGR